MAILVLVRHGQSQWNKEKRFTGWKDIFLTDVGRMEAKGSAQKLKDIKIDIAYTSLLSRASESLQIILKEINQSPQVIADQALNERDYGELTGKTHQEVIERYGEEQFVLWRRSWSYQPPGGESLKDTVARVLPYFKKEIQPQLENDQNVLVVASGNSLRALTKEVEGISEEDIPNLEIPTGSVRIYQFKNGKFKKQESF